MQPPRTPLQVTISVWYALFVREALSRTTADRMAWFWMLVEPAAAVLVFIALRAVFFGNLRHIDGAPTVPWMLVGLFGFNLISNVMLRGIGAMDANKALFSYRQIKPIDPVVVRFYVEAMLVTFIFLLFMLVAAALEAPVQVDKPLEAVFMWFILWLLGVGLGLIFSAVASLVPEMGKVIRILSMPLLIISGVIIPLQTLPDSFSDILVWNPIAQAIELLRSEFFANYRTMPQVSINYIVIWVLGTLGLGLLLHLRFERLFKRL